MALFNADGDEYAIDGICSGCVCVYRYNSNYSPLYNKFVQFEKEALRNGPCFPSWGARPLLGCKEGSLFDF